MIFEVVQKNFYKLGINAKQSKKSNPINKRIFVGLVGLFFNALFQILFIVNEAQGFQEYIQAIYMSSIGTFSFTLLVTIILQMESFFDFIQNGRDKLNELKDTKGTWANRFQEILKINQ